MLLINVPPLNDFLGWGGVVRILILNYKGEKGSKGKGRIYAHRSKGTMRRLKTVIPLERVRSDMRLMMIEIIQTSVSTSTSSEARTAR